MYYKSARCVYGTTKIPQLYLWFCRGENYKTVSNSRGPGEEDTCVILVIHSAVFNIFRWIHMNQREPTFTFHHRSLNQAHHISNRADKSDQMAPSYTVWSGTVMLIQRWMHAGYKCHNLIGDFSPAVRPGERQRLRFQHLHSALNSSQPLILHELECQSHLL